MTTPGDWLRRLFGRGEPVYDPLRAVARPLPEGPMSFAEGNNRFALALYERLRQRPGNLFFSPFSIRAALGMTLAGARGETTAQMRETLCAPLVDETLHVAVAAAVRRMEGRGRDYALSVSNSLWGQEGAVLRPEFLDVIARHYRGALHLVDFRGAPDAARLAINLWVEEETLGKITGLIPPGSLDTLTRLLLVNAVYFKGTWASEFIQSATRDEPFHLEAGGKVQMKLMHQRTEVRYLQARGFAVLDLAYRGGDLSLLVLLPDRKDGLRTLEETLSAAVIDDLVAHMRQRVVDLFLPRFTTTWGTVDLRDHLAALGMPLAFDAARADFSGINGHEPPHEDSLHVSAVFHKAFVEMNERGTEAAAATAVAVLDMASVRPPKPPPIPVFRADRPFLYAIRDRHSGALLFLGRMADPTRNG
jgi:serpin B